LIYLPTDPYWKVKNIVLGSGRPMQSAAKCPILVGFECEQFFGPDKFIEKINEESEKLKIAQGKFFGNGLKTSNLFDQDLDDVNEGVTHFNFSMNKPYNSSIKITSEKDTANEFKSNQARKLSRYQTQLDGLSNNIFSNALLNSNNHIDNSKINIENDI